MAEELSSKMNSLSLSQKMISLVTFDDVVFKIEPAIAKEMETVQSFIDETEGKITTIPLPNIHSHELPLIIDYSENNIAGKINKEYETKFVEKLDNEEVKDLFLAANYLNMKKLLEFLTQVIADRIANKSVEYVRKYFGIESDFTPEEEAKLREELAWTFTGVDEDEDEDEKDQDEIQKDQDGDKKDEVEDKKDGDEAQID